MRIELVGRKRHIVVDTDGRLLMVNVTTADISDSAGAQAILDAIGKRWPWVTHLFAGGACDRGKLVDKAALLLSLGVWEQGDVKARRWGSCFCS